MKIHRSVLFRLSIFLLSLVLVINPLNVDSFFGVRANAQSSVRPYVVFVNGYQDCCTWGRYTNGSPDPYMDTVVNALPSNSEIRYVPWDRFENGSNQRSSTSNDAEFLRQAAEFINQLDPNRPLILIGHSFGGDSLLSLAPRITRRIQFLGVIDPTAAGGLREPVTRRGVPSNVDYFFNRWQQNALASANIVPFDSRLFSGSISGCSARTCDQQEQSLARNADGSEIRINCESWEVSCPGYQPWPGGSNGTKAKRLAHNDMPSDAYLQRQIADRIGSVLANFRPSSTSPSFSSSPVFDPDFYLMTYGDLRNAFGTDQGAARNHWLTYGIQEGRRSSPAFDVRYYLSSYSDLRNAFSNDYAAAINHWLTYGIREGRRSSIVFDVQYYLNRYSDLQNAFGAQNYSAAVDHWLTYGVSEGRQGSPNFDPRFYLSNNPDVARVYGASNYKGAIEHYLEFGRSEGRQGTAQ